MRTPTLLVLVLFGCDGPGDPAPGGDLFANVWFAVGCDDGSCAPELHDLCGITGGDPCELTGVPIEGYCTATAGGASPSIGGSSVTIEFELGAVGGAALSVAGLVVPRAGGPGLGTQCELDFVGTDGTTLSGVCGEPFSPREATCTISSVLLFEENGEQGVQGDVWCSSISASDGTTRFLDGQGTGSAGSTVGHFSLLPCAGLEAP